MTPSAPVAAGPSFLTSDGSPLHSPGLVGFYFLQPTVRDKPSVIGTFDPCLLANGTTCPTGLNPIVHVCLASVPDCGAATPVATFTTSSTPAIKKGGTTAAPVYFVGWKTPKTLPLATYRIHVLAGTAGFQRELGFADVQILASTATPKQRSNATTTQQIGWAAGNSLNINFWIAKGIVGAVTVAPATASIDVGATASFTATVRDLHGVLLTGKTASWASAAPGVATVDASGLVTGVGAGAATITATSEGRSAQATVQVTNPTPLELASITVGGGHTCGLTTTGVAYCWGGGEYGQLGSGTTPFSQKVPVAVSGGLTFASVSAGTYHTCGLTTQGAAYCWGLNYYGGLGNGTSTASNVPVAVSGGLTFASLSAGDFHSCGVTPAGAAYCWGENGFGEIGTGSTDTYSNREPLAVVGGLTFASVRPGTQHTCGVTTAGAAYCWGANGLGELGQPGDGTTNISTVPVAVSGGLTFTSVSTGFNRSCGMTTTGAAYCWGENAYAGGLGNGTTTNSDVPVAVSGDLAFVSVSAGGYHNCGVTTAGAAYCWGYNGYGELGIGTNDPNGSFNSHVPAAVLGDLTFGAVSAGFNSTCGLTTAGAAYCWGWNVYGQLGTGTNTDSNVPVAVSGP